MCISRSKHRRITLEYQRWLWGKRLEIMTYDTCMKLSTDFVTRQQHEALRSNMEIVVG